MLSRAKHGMYILGNAASLEAYRKNTLWKQILKIMREDGCVGPEFRVKLSCHANSRCLLAPMSKPPERAYEDSQAKRFRIICFWRRVSIALWPTNALWPRLSQVWDTLPRFCLWMVMIDNAIPKISFTEKYVVNPSSLLYCHVVTWKQTFLVSGLLTSKGEKATLCFGSRDSETLQCSLTKDIQVDGCRYGHVYKVSCSKADSFKRNPKNCVQIVSVQMPTCGHKFEVKCYQERQALRQPELCKEPCNRTLKCGHPCQRKCGICVERAIRQYPHFILSPNNADRLDHGPCQSLCDKRLQCGHSCKLPCHEGENY